MNSCGVYLMMLPLRLFWILHCGEPSSSKSEELPSSKGSLAEASSPLSEESSSTFSYFAGVGLMAKPDLDAGSCCSTDESEEDPSPISCLLCIRYFFHFKILFN